MPLLPAALWPAHSSHHVPSPEPVMLHLECVPTMILLSPWCKPQLKHFLHGWLYPAAHAQSLSHVPLFVTPTDCSAPGPSVHGIFPGKVTPVGCHFLPNCLGFPGGSEGKVSACNSGDLGSIPGLGRSPGEGNGNALQYSCLENPWMEQPGRLQPIGSQRVGHNWATLLYLPNCVAQLLED